MKKILALLLAICSVCLFFTACGDTTNTGKENESSKVDIDLTKMDSTSVYNAVYDMIVQSPDSYIGKTVRCSGPYSPSYYEGTKSFYHYVVIADATACCSQGIEFVAKNLNYPSDFPASGKEIVIEGTFGTYTELDVKYYCIFTDKITVL